MTAWRGRTSALGGKSQSEQKFSALHQKAVTYARASSTGGGKAGGVVGVFEKGEEIVFGPGWRLGARHGQGSGDRCFGSRAWPRRLSGLAPAANGLPCRRAAVGRRHF